MISLTEIVLWVASKITGKTIEEDPPEEPPEDPPEE